MLPPGKKTAEHLRNTGICFTNNYRIGELVPIALQTHQLDTCFPILAVNKFLVNGDIEFHLENISQLPDKMVDLFSHLNIADQLSIDFPGVDHSQSQGSQFAKFNSSGWFSCLFRLLDCIAINSVTKSLGIVNAEKINAGCIMEIKMGES